MTHHNTGRPHPSKGKPRPNACGPRPHVWIVGPDPALHFQYVQWLQHKNQAQWRGEEYHLTFENYRELWKERWHQRGRTKDTYCLTREDYDLPWTMANSIVILRADHNRRQLHHRKSR